LISSEDVLMILIREFEEAPNDMRHVIRMKVMRLIKAWLTNKNVIICQDTLAEMHKFALTANNPDDLRDLALEVLQSIPDKASLNFSCSSIASSFGSRPDAIPNASQLAVALTTLEKERYLCILATEYISHARNLTSHSPNLQEALSLNKRITNWVMSSILQLDDHEDRSHVKIFFVNTAEECLKIRNFSSTCAILCALQSDTINRLELTHKTMASRERQRYLELTTLLRQEFNYSTYRTAVKRDATRGCIPWHEVHLHDISTVLKEEKNVEEHDEPPLINFEKWVHLKEIALSALRHRDMPLAYNADGLEMAMAYLGWQLRAVTVDDGFSLSLERRSNKLKQDEGTKRRDRAKRAAGF